MMACVLRSKESVNTELVLCKCIGLLFDIYVPLNGRLKIVTANI